MFGNLAALSWCISLFAPSFQLQFAICNLQSWELQSICDVMRYPAYPLHTACANSLSYIITGYWNKSRAEASFLV